MAEQVHRIGLLATALFVFGAVPALAACEDRDLDGYYSEPGCGTPIDCNDDDYFIHPGAPESCNGKDDDCNGLVDDSPACDRTCDNPQKFAQTTVVTTDLTARSEDADVVWVGDGWVVSYWTQWNQECTWIALQKLDPSGTPKGEPVIVSGGTGIEVAAREPRLAWTGMELAVTWKESDATPTACNGLPSGGFDFFLQRFSPDLKPLGNKTRLGCLTGLDEGFGDVAWGGRRFGTTWADPSGVRFAVVDRDGATVDSCGSLASNTSYSDHPAIAWSGSNFGVTYQSSPAGDTNGEIFFRRFDEDEGSPDPNATRETFVAFRSLFPHPAWGDGEWGVSWSDERDNPMLQVDEIYFMRLVSGGTKVDPPGDVRVTCCTNNTTGPNRDLNDIRWTGEEYGIAYSEANNPSLTAGDTFFQRVSKTGAVIGNPVLVTPDQFHAAYQVAMDWNGSSYGIVWADFPRNATQAQVLFSRVGCNCVDNDHDGFTTCAGNDCNDANPLVHPGAVETCLDGADNNCDGKIDCQDTTACPAGSGSPPSEAQNLRIQSDKQTWIWNALSGASAYDLLQGDLGHLRSDGDFSTATCLAWRVVGTSYVDAGTPIPERGRFVLVRGKADTCKLGTWGSALRDGAKLSCP